MNKQQIIFDFFLWFRQNGEKYMNYSIEKLIEIYLESLNENVYAFENE